MYADTNTYNQPQTVLFKRTTDATADSDRDLMDPPQQRA